MLIKVN